MLRVGQWITWVWVLPTSVLMNSQDNSRSRTDNSLPTQACDYVFKLKKGRSIALHVHNFTRSHYCTVHASADKNLRIVVDLVYSPHQVAGGGAPSLDCATDYVHVGNDVGRLDVELMTSYKFCGEYVRHQLISSSNHMWLVYRASQTPTEFLATVWAQAPVGPHTMAGSSCKTDLPRPRRPSLTWVPETVVGSKGSGRDTVQITYPVPIVTCAVEEFRCSPVQCVDRSRTCDGVKDCTNGHDEFCRRQGIDMHSDALTDPCFRCGDGTCILPRLSLYDSSYGRVLWYLCDGLAHCPDGWDERADICRDLSTGRLGSVMTCVPWDLPFGLNGSVIMWDEVLCNSVPDCYHGEDEDNCNRRDSSRNQLYADPATLGAVFGILVTAAAVVCITYRLKMSRSDEARPSTTSTVDTKCTLMASPDHDRPDVTSSGSPGCQAVSINTDSNLQPPHCDAVGDDDNDDDDDEEEEDYDDEASSLNSINLRHTIV